MTRTSRIKHLEKNPFRTVNTLYNAMMEKHECLVTKFTGREQQAHDELNEQETGSGDDNEIGSVMENNILTSLGRFPIAAINAQKLQ